MYDANDTISNSANEIERLESIAKDSWYAKGISSLSAEYSASVFLRYTKAGNLLELGPAEGTITRVLCERFSEVTVVEGSAFFCEKLRKNYPSIEVVHSLFESFTSTHMYDNIILGHVLEHVEDPVHILALCKSHLKEDGLIMAAVPNCNSVHRQAAVIMGLLDHVKQLNETDVHHGHRRVYSISELEREFLTAGFTIRASGGYWLKPLSNRQIEASWDEKMIDAFMVMGEKYPEIAAEIYVVATL